MLVEDFGVNILLFTICQITIEFI